MARNLRTLMRDRLPDRAFALLEQAGKLAERTGVSAFVVGGFVRDLLLGRPNLDLDVAIEGDGLAFAKRLADSSRAGLKLFERFTTASVVLPDGTKVDVATARREHYAHPTALPTVEPSSIQDDLYRRDFTINAMAVCLNPDRFGALVDCYGSLRDLTAKTIRMLHDRSFVDDPTRIFRALRFEQRFGFRIESKTMALLKEAAATDLIHRLSGPRLRNEVKLLLSEQNPLPAIRRLAELDLLRFLHARLRPPPQIEARLKATTHAIEWWTKQFPERTPDHWLVYLMTLLDESPAPIVETILTRLTLPTRESAKVRAAKRRVPSVLRALATSQRVRPSRAYRLLADLSDESLILLAAKAGSKDIQDLITAHVTTYQHVKPSLTGADLKALGLKPGPLYKKILDRLRDARLNGTVTTEADERALVKRLAKLQERQS